MVNSYRICLLVSKENIHRNVATTKTD
jgi:hypothetical protein